MHICDCAILISKSLRAHDPDNAVAAVDAFNVYFLIFIFKLDAAGGELKPEHVALITETIRWAHEAIRNHDYCAFHDAALECADCADQIRDLWGHRAGRN